MSEQESTTTEATAEPTGATPADVASAIHKGLNGPEEPSSQTQGDPGEAALGDAGKRALQAERDAREAAEREARTHQQEAESLREQVNGVPKAVADTLRTHLVALHNISDEDRDLFLTSDDPETLLKQVSRLTQREAAATAPTTPKPDRTQGGTGEPPALNSDALENALRSKLGIA